MGEGEREEEEHLREGCGKVERVGFKRNCSKINHEDVKVCFEGGVIG